MTDPTDDQLRSALRAEADGVTAGDDLLAHIRAEVTDAPARPRVGRWLLAAAAVVAVVGGGTFLLTTDDDEPEGLDIVGTTTTTTTTVAPTTTTLPPPPPRPRRVVAVTEDGRLVVLDVRSGAETSELWALDDPRQTEVEGGPYSISGVRLHPNGRDVYVETCCEPAAGAVFVTPIDDPGFLDRGDRTPIVNGYGIDVAGGSGRWLSYLSGPLIGLRDLETGETRTFEPDPEEAYDYVQSSVHRDGTSIVVEHALRRDAGRIIHSEVIEFRFDGDRLVEVDRIAPGDMGQPGYHEPEQRLWGMYSFGDDGFHVGGTLDDYRAAAFDPSGHHLLWVDSEGRIVWEAGPGKEAHLDTDTRFLAADW